MGLVTRSVVPEERVISDNRKLPGDHNELAVVATDEVIFLHVDRAGALERLSKYDMSMAAHGVPRAAKTDVDAQDSTIGLGCCLRGSQPWVDMDASKAWQLILAVCGLALRPRAYPPPSAPCWVWHNGSRFCAGRLFQLSIAAMHSCGSSPPRSQLTSQLMRRENSCVSHFWPHCWVPPSMHSSLHRMQPQSMVSEFQWRSCLLHEWLS